MYVVGNETWQVDIHLSYVAMDNAIILLKLNKLVCSLLSLEQLGGQQQQSTSTTRKSKRIQKEQAKQPNQRRKRKHGKGTHFLDLANGFGLLSIFLFLFLIFLNWSAAPLHGVDLPEVTHVTMPSSLGIMVG